MRAASMDFTSSQVPVMARISRSSTKPGLIPVPKTVTPCWRARRSISSDSSGSCAHGQAISSAVVMTFRPCSTQSLTFSNALLVKESVPNSTTSHAPFRMSSVPPNRSSGRLPRSFPRYW